MQNINTTIKEKLNSYEIPTCTICMEELIDDLQVTPCGHIFHGHW